MLSISSRRVMLAVLLCLIASASLGAESARFADIAIYPQRSAPATALSLNETQISSQLQALVADIPVEVGQAVKRGAKLLSLDCADYRLNAQLAEARQRAAQARLELAATRLTRNIRLREQNLSSQDALDTQRAENAVGAADLDVARAELQRARLQVSRCVISAPFEGVVIARQAAVGQLANIGSPLLTLVDSGAMELSANVAASEIPSLQAARQRWFEHDSRYPVSLLRIGAVLDSRTRNQEVRLQFVDKRPLPGAAGKVLWLDPRPHLPAEAIVSRGGKTGFFVSVDGRAKFIALPDAISGLPWPVELDADTLVVHRHLGSVQDGEAL